TKFHTMIFGTQQNIKTKFKSSSYVITCLDGTPLKKVEHIKYLGLWLDCGLSFKYHIDHTVKKLNFSLSVLICLYYQFLTMQMLFIWCHQKQICIVKNW